MVTLHCEGKFAVDIAAVHWLVNSTMPLNVMCWEMKTEVCYRYQQTPYPNNRGANLTVNVTEDDFYLPLSCRVYTAQIDAVLPCVTVYIVPYPPDEKRDIGLLLPIVVPVAVIILLLLTCLCYYLYEPQITFFFYTWYTFKCQKHHKGRFGCDILVVHDDDDHTFVREHIAPNLKSLAYLKYKTMAKDLSAGRFLFEGTRELMEDSHSVMFIITPGILNEALFSHLLNVAVRLKRQILLVTVHKEGLKLTSWETLRKSYSKSETLANGLQYMKPVRWPGNKASGRQIKNFWCKIRRQLPIVKPGNHVVSHKYTPCLNRDTFVDVSKPDLDTVTA
ncbi:uncharacterized protein LOC135472619 isoform X2 [Liolophura sinensis]